MGNQDPEELDPRTAELFSQLSRETERLLVDSPSPSEIRRLGERRRTLRRTGYTAGALSLAVLATAGGLALRDGPVQAKPLIEAAATAPATALHSPTPAPVPSTTPSALLPTPSFTAARSTASAAPSATAESARGETPPGTAPASAAVPSTQASNDNGSTHSNNSVAPGPVDSPATATHTTTPPPSSGPATPETKGSQPSWEALPTNIGAGVLQDAQSSNLPQEPFSICQVDIDDIAAQTTLVRHFTSGDGRVNSYAVVFGYEDEDQAVASRRIMRGWYTGCAARLEADGNEATQTKALPLSLDGAAAAAVDPVDGASFRKVVWGSAGTTPIEEQATIIQADNRVLWVVHNITDRTDMGSTGHAQSWAETLLS